MPTDGAEVRASGTARWGQVSLDDSTQQGDRQRTLFQ